MRIQGEDVPNNLRSGAFRAQQRQRASEVDSYANTMTNPPDDGKLLHFHRSDSRAERPFQAFVPVRFSH